MRFIRHQQPMTSPLGKKLRAAGYQTLWEYLERRGFTDLETFLRDVDFETLAPVGFQDFVLRVRNWTTSGIRAFARWRRTG